MTKYILTFTLLLFLGIKSYAVPFINYLSERENKSFIEYKGGNVTVTYGKVEYKGQIQYDEISDTFSINLTNITPEPDKKLNITGFFTRIGSALFLTITQNPNSLNQELKKNYESNFEKLSLIKPLYVIFKVSNSYKTITLHELNLIPQKVNQNFKFDYKPSSGSININTQGYIENSPTEIKNLIKNKLYNLNKTPILIQL